MRPTASALIAGCLAAVLAIPCAAVELNTETGELTMASFRNAEGMWVDVTLSLNPDGTYDIEGTPVDPQAIYCDQAALADNLRSVSAGMTLGQVEGLLGCGWYFRSESRHYGQFAPAPTITYEWVSGHCRPAQVYVDQSGQTTGGTSRYNPEMGCLPARASGGTGRGIYEAGDARFTLPDVLVDDAVVARAARLERIGGDRLRLISFEVPPAVDPAVLCDSLSQSDFDSISQSSNLNNIQQLLGCQWGRRNAGAGSSVVTYTWFDRECNELSVTIDEVARQVRSKSISTARYGCGS